MPVLIMLLAACAPPAGLPSAELPPPRLELIAPEHLFLTEPFHLRVRGTLGQGEIVQIFAGVRGRGPCLPWLGGRCLGVRNARQVGQVRVDADGDARLEGMAPAGMPADIGIAFQAVVVRGRQGQASLLSDVEQVDTIAGPPGCTDPVAYNYDPLATWDDGSCYGCAGSEGDFAPTADTVLSGTHTFNRFGIPAGVTVRAGDAPLDIHVCGPVHIDGLLDASGAAGGAGSQTTLQWDGSSYLPLTDWPTPGAGGVGIAGGHPGGAGTSTMRTVADSGAGPGGASGGRWQDRGQSVWGGSGGGAGHVTWGEDGVPSFVEGFGGRFYGDAELSTFPDVGGSGGGGGALVIDSSGTAWGGGGGGGGGGVVRISADGPIYIGPAGRITASGGVSDTCQSDGRIYPAGGGGGSGGAIWLRGPSLDQQGIVLARGGFPCAAEVWTPQGIGADGRIRVDLPAGMTPTGIFSPEVGHLGTWP